MRNSLCISISQDKRASRFQMRFRCCDPQLNVYTGIAAHMRDAGDVPPLGEVEPLVRSELRRRRGEQALRSYLDGLRAAARLEMPEQLP